MATGDVHFPTLLPAVGCTRNKVGKWHRSGYLSRAPEGRAGVPTVIPYNLALEISFMSALTTAGIAPAPANKKARAWIDALERGRREARLLNPVGGTEHRAKNLDRHLNAEKELVDFPDRTERRPPLVLIAINVPEIVRRVDELARLYAEHLEANEERNG